MDEGTLGIGWKWLVFWFLMILCSTIYVGRWGLTIRKCKKVTHTGYGGHAIMKFFSTENCVEKKEIGPFLCWLIVAWSLNQNRSLNLLRIYCGCLNTWKHFKTISFFKANTQDLRFDLLFSIPMLNVKKYQMSPRNLALISNICLSIYQQIGNVARIILGLNFSF